ncbi:MAG TPA: efflux RND transporter periplasmic adaptor subunit [Kofleriaceae bacterium]|nr:efflux RND transporter periplasmic adaptor subunit [Kofleriaceae bacterium]
MRCALVMAIACCACGDQPGPRAPVEPPPAPAAGPAAAPVSSWTGVIASAEAVDVAPDFDGVLARVVVRPGDQVTAGQVLAHLDERPLREELDAARAALRETRARGPRVAVDIRSARRRVQIEQQAVAAGTSARRVLEEARFALASALAARGEVKAAVAQARTRVDRASARLGKTALRAPFAGAVGARYRDAGAAVGPLAPVVRLIGGGGLRLRFAVTPEAARALAPGAAVIAEVDAMKAPLEAVVEQIAPELDQPSQRVFVDAALDPTAAGALQPGLPARVRLLEGSAP